MTDSQLPAATAQKFGTLIPNRIFVGGISAETTESELCRVFSAYGNVKSTKIIVDRAGVSKGYGFVTFETELEASRLHDGRCVILRDRKLNIAPAIKKQTFVAPNETIYYAATTHPGLINNIPIEQFPQAAAALYSPGVPSATALYPQTMTPAYPFYQPFIQPMNVPAIWPPNYQAAYTGHKFI
ncbi:protein boule-like [Chironomus tepperi]|uniref:protein boule-like n=1 Tax=Chironomus tepperi TaxID=113505 RepID=UPI00391F7DE9